MKVHPLAKIALAVASGFGFQQATLAAPVPMAQTQAAVATDMVDLHVYLPLKNQADLEALVARQHDPASSQYQQWLKPEEFMRRFGPSAADLSRVRAALTSRGFAIVDSHAHGFHVRGAANAVTRTFGTELRKVTEKGRQRFLAQSTIQAPNELQDMDIRVFGLASIPHRHVMSRTFAKVSDAAVVDNRYGPIGPYWYNDLKQAYDYPAYSKWTDGSGVSVAILMSDLLYPGDLKAMFDHEQFTATTGKPAPTVSTVLIDGGGVQGGGGSLEASLDVQQVLGGAPGAKVTLVSIPDLSDTSVADGYRYIVDSNAYDIVNSSFGGCELFYTPAYNDGVDYTYQLKTQHELFLQGNAQGITFVASSGDEGGLECPTPDYFTPGSSAHFVPGVSNPASDPSVTAVGGGNLTTKAIAGSFNSAYVSESAFGNPQDPYDPYDLGQNVSGGYWGAGGGISTVFAKPVYQYLANTGSSRWRTVPDVGMMVGGTDADNPAVVVAYGVGIGGGYYGVIGTSVSSPEFVGALALYQQSLGKNHRLGNVNYFLYTKGVIQAALGGARAPSAFQYFHRNIPGYDGYWKGGYPSQNYDYIYGNGSPDVRKLFDLTAYPPAGVPRTPSNP